MDTLIGSLFDELDTMDRAVCVLIFKWGMDRVEIAEIFGIDTALVDGISSRAKLLLENKISMEETVCTLQ